MSYVPRLTRREQELQKAQTLEQYKEKVVQEARRRLGKSARDGINVTHLNSIRNQDNFESDVSYIVMETLDCLN